MGRVLQEELVGTAGPSTLKLVFPHVNHPTELPPSVADNMIENCVGKYELPLGLGLNFVINNQAIVVPMAVEEPSVIAAVSGAAKTIGSHGGFAATASGNVMIAQIQLLDVKNPEQAALAVSDNKIELIAYANSFCHSMVRRGGGVVDIRARLVPWSSASYLEEADKAEFMTNHSKIDLTDSALGNQKARSSPVPAKDNTMLIIHVHIDVCESMGANLCSTVAEGLAPKIIEVIGSGRSVLRIVSNLAEERRARATFLVPASALEYKGMDGVKVAQGIIEAYAMACEDHYRCSTHNKGIMNGIDSAAIAMGQDWRAIEAAAHTWACRSGRYQPLSQYKILRDKATQKVYLFGSCEMPIAVGVRGGAIQSHPITQFTHGVTYNPTCQQLAQILVCVGLAQNFAAMRALVSEGIQRGHMSLHSRNLAISAGAPPHLISEVSNYMVSIGRIDHETAVDYLRSHQIVSSSTQNRWKAQNQAPPSTLFVELELNHLKLTLNIVFETIGTEPFHFPIIENEANDISAIQKQLFGEKTVEWFKKTLTVLDRVRVVPPPQQKPAYLVQSKLKLLSILLNLLAYRLLKLHPDPTQEFIEKLVSSELQPLSGLSSDAPEVLRAGLALMLAIWTVYRHHVEANFTSNLLANALKEEQQRIFSALYRARHVNKTAKSVDRFMITHIKRWQVTIFLLCDMQALNLNLITPERLFFTFKLGTYLEWEGTIAHDLARWERDAEEGEPNIYVFWLNQMNKSHNEQSLRAFTDEMEVLLQAKKQKLLATKVAVEMFDVKLFLNAVPVVREHYGLPRASLVKDKQQDKQGALVAKL